MVLSCGRALARAAEAGQPMLVATIFGGEMPAGLVPGKHIKGFHAASDNAPNLVATRGLEDAAAFALLHGQPRAARRSSTTSPTRSWRKLEAVAAHAMQVRLFGSVKAMQHELTRYGQRAGGGRPAEREWTEA